MRHKIANRFSELIAIKARREQRKLNITVICEDTGLARNTVRSWLRNHIVRFDTDSLFILCQYLGCTPGDLLMIEEDEELESIAPLHAIA